MKCSVGSSMIEVMNVRQELYVIVNLISITYNLIYFGHTHNIFSDSLTDKNTTSHQSPSQATISSELNLIKMLFGNFISEFCLSNNLLSSVTSCLCLWVLQFNYFPPPFSFIFSTPASNVMIFYSEIFPLSCATT